MDKFFGSKLNTVLLVVLIIILLFTLNFMKNNSVQKEEVIEIPIEEGLIKEGMIGNKDDLISFTIYPYNKISGIKSYRGSIKGGYFFEGNILINVTDMDGNILLASNAVATSEWMTAAPVEFEGNLDFTNLPKGPAYIQIHNDNASALPENDKSVSIPIVIE